MKIKKVLEDGTSDWLQNWMTASSLDVKVILFFSLNQLVFPNTVTYGYKHVAELILFIA